jgi:hypothetical protein
MSDNGSYVEGLDTSAWGAQSTFRMVEQRSRDFKLRTVPTVKNRDLRRGCTFALVLGVREVLESGLGSGLAMKRVLLLVRAFRQFLFHRSKSIAAFSPTRGV